MCAAADVLFSGGPKIRYAQRGGSRNYTGEERKRSLGQQIPFLYQSFSFPLYSPVFPVPPLPIFGGLRFAPQGLEIFIRFERQRLVVMKIWSLWKRLLLAVHFLLIHLPTAREKKSTAKRKTSASAQLPRFFWEVVNGLILLLRPLALSAGLSFPWWIFNDKK